MTDFRALCAELVDELEDWIAYGDEADCADAHAVVDRARAALAQPEPQEPTDEELREMWLSQEWFNEGATFREFASIVRRWGRPAIEPVPVSERPWERKGWYDAQGQCWMGDGGGGGFVPSWRLCKPSDSSLAWSLPHHALPVPQQEVK